MPSYGGYNNFSLVYALWQVMCDSYCDEYFHKYSTCGKYFVDKYTDKCTVARTLLHVFCICDK